MTDREHAEIAARAGALGLGVAEYLRRCALGDEVDADARPGPKPAIAIPLDGLFVAEGRVYRVVRGIDGRLAAERVLEAIVTEALPVAREVLGPAPHGYRIRT